MAYTDRLPRKEAWLKAEGLLAKGIEIDTTSSKAHVLVGMIKLQFRCDRAGGEKELNLALELRSGKHGRAQLSFLLSTGNRTYGGSDRGEAKSC